MSIRPWRQWTVAVVLPLVACAHADTAPVPGLRVILTTATEWPSTAQVSDRASRLAGVAARNAVEDGPRRYYMTLDCHSEPDCRDAMARIAADRMFALGIERDARQRLPARPAGEASR
jgi:hypothetical protein